MCNYNGFSQYCGLADVKPMPVVRVEKSKVDRQDKDKDILDFIFACASSDCQSRLTCD